MSKAHIGSDLILDNSLIGLDESMVAYFPFKHSANDAIYGIEPTTNNNTTLTEDGIAIEEATTNLFNFNASWRCWPSSSSNMNSLTTKTGEHSFSVKGISNVPGAYSYIYPMFSTTNNIHSWSVTIKNNHSKNLKVSLYGKDGSNGANLSSSSIFYIKPFETQRIKHTDTIPVSLDSITMALSIYSDDIDGYVNCEGFDIQLEQKSFATSFVNGSRSAGLFSYPSFNWNESFTIMMDNKVPSITNYRMQGGAWSTWYFSWHSNSSSALLLSWMDGTQKTMSGTIPGLDCREWNKIGFSYDSNLKAAKIYANGKVAASGSCNLSTKYPAFTSIGSISSGSHSYKLNGLIKNYSVYNRVLSDDEVLQIYLNKDSFYSSNEDVIF